MSDGGWPAMEALCAAYPEAAAQARAASRRYWQRGGEADRRFPCQPMPWWPEAPDPVEQRQGPATERGLAG